MEAALHIDTPDPEEGSAAALSPRRPGRAADDVPRRGVRLDRPSPFDLTGKVALITRGNGDIGLGMADGLALAGARRRHLGSRAREAQGSRGKVVKVWHPGHAAVVDVSDEDAVASAIADTVHSMGRIDAVFANAGVGGRTKFLDLDTAELHRIVAINLEGTLWTLREAARHMVARAEAGEPGGLASRHL